MLIKYAELVNIDEMRSNMDDYGDKFAGSRDKVCEIAAVRALVRPLKERETRVAAASSARDTVRTLDGQLKPRLGLMLNAAAEPSPMQ